MSSPCYCSLPSSSVLSTVSYPFGADPDYDNPGDCDKGVLSLLAGSSLLPCLKMHGCDYYFLREQMTSPAASQRNLRKILRTEVR
jgi:hypothetical protein